MAIYTRADHLATDVDYEPQRQHNWVLELNLDGDDDSIALSIVNGFLPTRYNDELAIPYGNEVVYAAGKMMWDQGAVTLRDWVRQRTAKLLLDWQVEVGNPTTGAIGFAASYKRDASIVLFPPDTVSGEGTETAGEKVWTLHGAWPIRVNPAVNGLDMTTSGQVLIELLLRFDKATAAGSYLNVNYNPAPRQSVIAPVL
jgi:hypothetical protein